MHNGKNIKYLKTKHSKKDGDDDNDNDKEIKYTYFSYKKEVDGNDSLSPSTK